MRKLLLMVLLVLCCNVYAQKHDAKDLTRLVVVSQKDKEIYCRVLIDKVKIHPDLKVEYYWCQNQQIYKNRGGYSGNLLHGKFKSFDSEKRLIEEGVYVYGKKDGTWKFWDENGGLIRITSWKDGLRNGLHYHYFNDKQFIKERYIKDRLHGRRIHQTNDSICYDYYRNGNLVKHKSVALNASSLMKKVKKDRKRKKVKKEIKEKKQSE